MKVKLYSEEWRRMEELWGKVLHGLPPESESEARLMEQLKQQLKEAKRRARRVNAKLTVYHPETKNYRIQVAYPEKYTNLFYMPDPVSPEDEKVQAALRKALHPSTSFDKVEEVVNMALSRYVEGVLSSLEGIYNIVCDQLPFDALSRSWLYPKIHSLLRKYGFSNATLRQYKYLRIEKTNDYRGEVPTVDKRTVETVMLGKNNRASYQELLRGTGWEKPRLEEVIRKLQSEGKVRITQERLPNRTLRDVYVLVGQEERREARRRPRRGR